MSQYSIKNGVVYKGDTEQGLIDDNGKFIPADGLHHKSVEAIEKFLQSEKGPFIPGGEEATTPAPEAPKYDPAFTGALDILGNALDILEINAPIYRKEGKAEQADLNEKNAESIRALMLFVGVEDPDSWKPVISEATPKEPEPAYDPMYGDLAPDYIEWHRRNHSEEEHRAKYGNRLANIRPQAEPDVLEPIEEHTDEEVA